MHGRELGFSGFGLWLWPLPSAETFEFAVVWPFGGIELTITELDGAAIMAAAGRSAYYWPDTGHSPEVLTATMAETQPGEVHRPIHGGSRRRDRLYLAARTSAVSHTVVGRMVGRMVRNVRRSARRCMFTQ